MDDRTESYIAFQQGAERFASAMNGVADRIPVYAQMHQFVRNELGVSAKRFYSSPDILVKGTLETMAAYGIDVPLIDYDVYNIEAEALGQKIIYDERLVPEIDRSAPLLEHRSDLNKIKTPNFNSDGRLPIVLEMYALFQELTGVAPVPNFCAPFSLAANIRGLEPLLNDLDEAPEFAANLFECLTEKVLAPWIRHLKQRFPNAKGMCGNDAYASLPIVSPSITRKWIIPYILRLRELCGADVYVPNWVGEAYLKKNPEAFLDCKLQVCPSFIEGQDPDVAKLGPQFYKNYALCKGVALVLGIGARFLALGSEAEVSARVRYYAAVGGENGRFALYLCNLDAGTPPGNIKAVVDALNTM